jgi:hypothetical protein
MYGAWEGILAIIAYMAFLAVVFTGLGLAFQKLFHIESVDLDKSLNAFWVGFAITVGVLQIWHFFLPITGYALLIVTFGGAAGLWWNRTSILEFARTKSRRQIGLGAASALLIAVWAANHSAGPPTARDSAIYHISAVRWNTNFPVVPGLANLHGRLGFNSSVTLYDALLEWGPWCGCSNHVANGLLLFVFLLQILGGAARIARVSHRQMAPYVFDLV